MTEKIQISVVIPAYNEQDSVVPLYDELKHVLDRIKSSYEIIFVDDGSSDKTFERLSDLNKKDKRVRVIRLRRNFGQSAAMDAGFNLANGSVIVTMDADLQNDPNDIPSMISKLKEGFDVVCGWRHQRKDSISKRFFSLVANIIRRVLTKETVHDSGCSLRVYKREAAKNLDLHGEMHRYIPAILSWKGYGIGEIKVNHRPRKHGKTKYGFSRLIKGFLDLLVIKFWMQYSARPIHLFGGLGVISMAVGVALGVYLTIMKIFYNIALSNRPLLLLAVLLVIIGVLFFIFGILADILVKIYYKDIRPYNVEEILDGNSG